MKAIRRVLESISGGQYKHYYPQIEELLDQPISACFTSLGQDSTEEGISCLAEILYNQDSISPRMWKFYQTIIDLYVNDRGILDEYIQNASVPLINYMSKNPEEFRTASFDGLGSCMDLMFTLIAKIFHNAREKEDEIEAICAVTLLISMLEHVQGIEPATLHSIVEFYVKELTLAETPEYKCMLIQGICMCLWYNTVQTLISLDQLGCTNQFFTLVFNLVETLKQDFEIKRFIIGLSSLIQKDQSELSQSAQQHLSNVIKAVVFLCQKSIIVRTKQAEKEEMCDEDGNAETGVINEDEEDECEIYSDEEDDEDYDCNEDIERDLYDSKLDQIDDVIFFSEVFSNLQ